MAPNARSIREVLDRRSISPVFQPIIDLDSGLPAGYEALARGAADSDLKSPAELFEAAKQDGSIRELDWLCRESAVDIAREAGVRYPLSLFINAEPETLDGADEERDRWAAFGDLRCYAELTERALLDRPADLVRAADQIRSQDWGIALDDIGAAPESLALMPLLQPDVLKLDIGLLKDRADLDTARVVHAVLAQAADTGAAVIAEGIETQWQLDRARSYGVEFGQGFLLGRPGPLPTPLTRAPVCVPLMSRVVDRRTSPAPFAVVASQSRIRRLPEEALIEVVRQLVAQATALRPSPVLLATVPPAVRLPDALLPRFEYCAQRLPLVALLGRSTFEAPLAGVRLGVLDDSDPASEDLVVVVVSPHYAAVLVARPALDPPRGQGQEAQYDAVLSFVRGHAVGAANALLARLPDRPLATTGPAS